VYDAAVGGISVAYEYDIFISYKRDAETNRWIADHLEPLLKTYVELELGRAPRIFRDDKLEAGTTWPVALGAKLAGSRVLLALYTKTYFHSEWCTRELSAMLEREEQVGGRTATKPDGLIVPLILHDCEPLPAKVKNIQAQPIRECFNVRMRKDSPRAELLADEIGRIAKPIARAIGEAPQWRSAWRTATAQAFQQGAGKPRQKTVPRFAPWAP
jgi:hypothetical protein